MVLIWKDIKLFIKIIKMVDFEKNVDLSKAQDL